MNEKRLKSIFFSRLFRLFPLPIGILDDKRTSIRKKKTERMREREGERAGTEKGQQLRLWNGSNERETNLQAPIPQCPSRKG